jgi:hypothetical protein
MREIGILAIFTLTLSMAVLLPARADSIPAPGTTVETQFAVSGPAADQIQYQIFADETGEFNGLQAGQIDLTDTPLNKFQVPIFCPSGTNFWCTGAVPNPPNLPNPPDGQFGFQHDDINNANVFWGITFCFAQDGITAGGSCQPKNGAVTVPGYPFTTATCPNVRGVHAGDCTYAGIQWRQGFASLLDKGCVTIQPNCPANHGLVNGVFGGAAQSIDNVGDVPAQVIAHPGYSWEASCQPSLAAKCIGPYISGPYDLKGVCSWDSLHVTAGSTNCVSANNFDFAGQGTDSSLDGITWNPGTVNFCNAADHFIAAGIASGKDANCRLTTLLGPGGDVVFAIRLDSPNRLASGTAEFNRFCDLLNAPINTGQCSRPTNTGGTLRLVKHQLTVTSLCSVLCGLSTDGIATNTPNLGWHVYTGANTVGPAFNQQWGLYDSQFDSTICGGSLAVPASSVGQFPLANYVYSCNAKMDHYQEMVANNVTIAGATQSDQVAMEIFGNHTVNNPTISRTQQFAYAKGWQGVSDATGVGISTGNFWSLLNMWNPNPAVSGPTIRWGMKQGTSSLNPFEFTSPSEFNVLQEVYDTLLRVTPYIPTSGPQIIGWMADSYKLVQHSLILTGVTVDSNCPASIGTSVVQGCVKMLLRGDSFFQDGQQVTASDVKFSFENFNSTGGIVSAATSNTVDVVYDPAFLPTSLGGTESPGQLETLYVALKSLNAFALFDMTNVPIVPQHVWKTTGASGPCRDTSLSNPGSGKGLPQCTVDPAFLSGIGADPVANNMLIGSGPYICGMRNNPSDPTSGFAVLGGGCTSTGTSAVTTGSITLYRYGIGLNPFGSGTYFRSNANYKEFAWATNGHDSVNILVVSGIETCRTPADGPLCSHYAGPALTTTCTTAGPCFIGPVGGGVGVPFFLAKDFALTFYGRSWSFPVAYTSLDGALQPASPVSYEDGSQYT